MTRTSFVSNLLSVSHSWCELIFLLDGSLYILGSRSRFHRHDPCGDRLAPDPPLAKLCVKTLECPLFQRVLWLHEPVRRGKTLYLLLGLSSISGQTVVSSWCLLADDSFFAD